MKKIIAKKKLYLTSVNGLPGNSVGVMTRRPRAVPGQEAIEGTPCDGSCGNRNCDFVDGGREAWPGHFDTDNAVFSMCADGAKRTLGLTLKDSALYEVEMTLKLVRRIEAPSK